MKALLCNAFGPLKNLVVGDAEIPKPGPGQLGVEVHAAGINFPDLLIAQGLYQFRPDPPFSPGGEAAGIVTALGEGVEGFEVGDRVIVTGPYGCFAQHCVAEAKMSLKIPPHMDFVTAAGFTITYATSYHALKDRCRLQAGETLLVLGAAGGVGLTAVELGKLMGARVIAAASTAEKLEVAKQAGADECINYTQEDLKARLKELTGGKGVDAVYDPVGGSYSEPALRATGWNGRYLVIGFASGEIPKLPMNLPLLKGSSVMGVFWGSFAMQFPKANEENMRHLFELHRKGMIKPLVSEVYPLERHADAFACLSQRKARGKVILTMKEQARDEGAE